MTTQMIVDTVEGYVSRVNGHSVQLARCDGWLNFSPYADPAATAAHQGPPRQIWPRLRRVTLASSSAFDDCDGVDPDGPEDPERQVERQSTVVDSPPVRETASR